MKDVCIYRMSLSQSSGWKCFTVKCDRQEYNCLHHLVQFICWPIFFCFPPYMVTIETDPRLSLLPTCLTALGGVDPTLRKRIHLGEGERGRREGGRGEGGREGRGREGGGKGGGREGGRKGGREGGGKGPEGGGEEGIEEERGREGVEVE